MSSFEVRVAAVPAGLPRPADLAVTEVPVPVPGPGEILVRNRWFTVFAALRTLLAGVEGAPLPGLHVGDTLFGPAVGEVVTAPAGTGLRPGDPVRHLLGWREYAAVPAGGWQRLPDARVEHLAQGVTAYGALTRAAPVRPGDTVFVTGGAGSVGSLAGRVAKLLGAGRVVGSTGSPWKATRMLTELGYDAVVARGAAAELRAAAPGGVDVVFDNVGGEDLRAALAVANRFARVALVGALSGQLAPDGTGTAAPVELDSYSLILRQITLTGYSAVGDAEVRSAWDEHFAEWLGTGAITFPHVLVDGLDRAPDALHEVLTGRHLGTVVVSLD